MKRRVVHRDQIHVDTTFDALSVALLDSPTLQRLGRVYQLGFAHLVYRGGTHTRLSHVLGTAHVAGKLVDNLKRNYAPNMFRPPGACEPDDFLPGRSGDDIELRWDMLRHLVVWAAMLHDIGHVPLGHTLEDEFDGLYKKHDSFKSPRLGYLWRATEIGSLLQSKDLYPQSMKALEIEGRHVYSSPFGRPPGSAGVAVEV